MIFVVIFVVKTSTLGIIGHRASLGTGLGLHVEFGRSFHLLHEHLGREGAQGSAPDQRNVNGSHISSGDSELPCHKNLSTAFCWNMLEPSKRTGAKPIAASPVARVSLSPQICDHPMDYPTIQEHQRTVHFFGCLLSCIMSLNMVLSGIRVHRGTPSSSWIQKLGTSLAITICSNRSGSKIWAFRDAPESFCCSNCSDSS